MIDLSRYTMNIKELSEYICVHRNTISNWVKAGILPCFNVGSYTRFDPCEIEQFLKSRILAPTSCKDSERVIVEKL